MHDRPTRTAVAAIAFALALLNGARADVPLTEDGTPVAVLVHNGHTKIAKQIPSKANARRRGHIKPAVEALQNYLEQMTGAKLPLVETEEAAGDKPAIVLQLVDHVPGASDKETGKQAYRITTEGNRVYLTAAQELGLHHAVFGFLEDHLGCHFYSVKTSYHGHGVSRYRGPGHEVVPERKTLTIPVIDDLQEPALPNRGLIFKMGQYPWILKNRAVGARGGHTSSALAAGHTMYHWIPPKDKKRGDRVVQKGIFDEHPEFFPMNKAGKRQPEMWNQGICGTAEKLPEYLADKIFAKLGDAPKDTERMFKIGQGDGFVGCHCKACRKLVREQGSEAAPLIHVFNRTLDIVTKKYPNVNIITFCYFNSLEAPKKMKVHDNLWVNVVSSARSKNAAGDQMGPIQNNPGNADYARALKEWPRIAPGRVMVWHWDTYRPEWPSMFYVEENVRYMADCGVFGINPQTCGGPWSSMLNWLYMKLNWNPDQDGDALIRQYTEDTYSKAAAPHLVAYLETGKQAYEAALHVPSAVRWSGWTRITMDKLFPESVRRKMIPLMDKAQAAAEQGGTEAQQRNLLRARVGSLDKVVLEAAMRIGDWGNVTHEGKAWYVPGTEEEVPPVLQRLKAVAGNSIQSISRRVRGKGGPVVSLTSAAITAEVCSELSGRVVVAVDKKSGAALLDARDGNAGYGDVFPKKVFHQIWLPAGVDVAAERDDWAALWTDYEWAEPARLKTETVLSPRKFQAGSTLLRTITATDHGLAIERAYTGDTKLASAFTTSWRLAMPAPRKSRVTIKGGGIKELMDLRYAEPGGIRTVKAGQRPPGYEGLDAMDEKWDAVQAVSDAQVVTFEVKDDQGELQILLDRGDGVAAVVTTPAAGWSQVKIKPVVGEHYLELTLVGDTIEADAKRVENLALPLQVLGAKTMPAGEAVPEKEPPAPKIRVTGKHTAVNEVDGAALVWVPAGAFTRGSDDDVAGADEQPVRKIHLDGYWVYKTPVTVGQYKAFCEATGREFKPPWPQGMKADPVGEEDAYAVTVNWFQARDYARWARGDLPTEAQWEKAARGTDARAYPWGNEWDPAKCVSMENTLYKFNEGFRPVGSHPQGASPCGALDMAGNVWEWTRDWYCYEYYGESPDKNPTGPEAGANKVLRGGCALYDWRFSRTTARFVQPPQVDNWTATGFRCVIEGPAPEAAQK